MYDGMMAETIRLRGHRGDEITGYLARPLGPGPFPGVVVIHHMPGYDASTKEITRTFATHGYNALCPNLHYRAFPDGDPGEAARLTREGGGVPDEQCTGDVAGASAVLRSMITANGKVGVIGYCSGGRQSYLVACSLPFDAAVDCYGGRVAPAPEEITPESPPAVVELTTSLSCPLLGLFGANDGNPSPEQTARIESALRQHGKEHEFHTYEDAGHAFFSVDRPNFNVAAANDGWLKIWDFFGRHLAGIGDVMTYARNGDVEIFHETFGDPADPALLLVNGLGSQCITYRVEWCEQFAAEGFHVIRFDNRDVGLSTKLTALYSIDDMAADAIAVLDAVGVERAHVMGVSMGGMIVQAMAIRHPARLLSMTSVMSNTGEPGFGHGSTEARASLGAPPPRDRAESIEYYVARQHVIGSPGCWDDDRLREIAGELYDRCFHPEGIARQMMAITTAPSRDDALRAITVPTLVLHGDRDPLVDVSGGVHTAEVIPGATFVVMEGMGHDYPPQYWNRWVQLVTDHARAAAAPT